MNLLRTLKGSIFVYMTSFRKPFFDLPGRRMLGPLLHVCRWKKCSHAFTKISEPMCMDTCEGFCPATCLT